MRARLMLVALTMAAACSNDVTVKKDPTGGGGSAPTGAGGSTPATVTSVGATGGGAGGSANASSGSGTECCNQPVEVAGMVKTITADTDVSRLASGAASPGTKIADGPFVLTDAASNSSQSWTVYLTTTGDCAQVGPAVIAPMAASGQRDLHGLRIFVPAGSALCAQGDNFVFFSGFHPY